MEHMMNDDEIRIHDGDTLHTFTGTLQGFATTEERTSLRWSEVEIYRTSGGNFVLVKYGRSDVVHRPGATCAATNLPTVPFKDGIPCPLCAPDVANGQTVQAEIDRVSVHVAKDEAALHDVAHTRQNGQVFLTNVARRALSDAGIRSRPRVQYIS